MSDTNITDTKISIPSKEVIQKLFDELYDLSYKHLSTNTKLINPQMEVNKVFMILIKKLLFYSYINCFNNCKSEDELFKYCVTKLITKILDILTKTIKIYEDISGNLNYENLFKLYLSLLEDNFYYINYIIVYLNDFISKYIRFLEHSGGGNKYEKIINEPPKEKTIYNCENKTGCNINNICYEPSDMLKIKTLTPIQEVKSCNDLLIEFNINYSPQIVSQIILPIKEIYKNLQTQKLITVIIENYYNTVIDIGYILSITCTYKLNEIKEFTECGFETYIKNKIQKESSRILNLFKTSKIKKYSKLLDSNIKSICYKFSDPNILESTA